MINQATKRRRLFQCLVLSIASRSSYDPFCTILTTPHHLRSKLKRPFSIPIYTDEKVRFPFSSSSKLKFAFPFQSFIALVFNSLLQYNFTHCFCVHVCKYIFDPSLNLIYNSAIFTETGSHGNFLISIASP